MAALTTRQRTKVNAVLTCLHHNGFDAARIEASAKAMIASAAKTNPAQAYERAVASAVATRPDINRRLERIAAQIDASDDSTVAQYDCALREYIRTGDPRTIASVERIAARDAVELAVRNGEIKAADVAAGRIDWTAIGMEPAAASAALAHAPAAPQAPRTSEFAFTPPTGAGGTGNPAGWSASGYSSARAQAAVQPRSATGAPLPDAH